MAQNMETVNKELLNSPHKSNVGLENTCNPYHQQRAHLPNTWRYPRSNKKKKNKNQ